MNKSGPIYLEQKTEEFKIQQVRNKGERQILILQFNKKKSQLSNLES